MKVEVINTGTELLLGDILNTNFQYLSRRLNSMGFDVLYQTTVGDNPERMKQVLESAMARADIIITSGGLGPTRGDITKEIVMEVCHTEAYLDLDTWGRIDAFFQKKVLVLLPTMINKHIFPLVQKYCRTMWALLLDCGLNIMVKPLLCYLDRLPN